jgi:hypothetical protein
MVTDLGSGTGAECGPLDVFVLAVSLIRERTILPAARSENVSSLLPLII